MTTTGYSSFPGGPRGRHGPIPTVVYVCEPDAATAERRAELCRDHAAQRTWWVVDTVIEEDIHAPLDTRPGWRRVKAALADGSAGIVVTWSPASVAAGLSEFQGLQATFRAAHAVLVAVTDVPEPPPPRRGDASDPVAIEHHEDP